MKQDNHVAALREALIFSAGWIESGRPIDGLAARMREAATQPPAPVAAKPEPCPMDSSMGVHACKNRHQCWEPCGELGHSAEHARPAPQETQDAVNAALGLTAKPEQQAQAGEPEVVAWAGKGIVSGALQIVAFTESYVLEQGTNVESMPLITLQSHRKAIAKKDAALLADGHECTRSHPHENMSQMCELRTEIARLTHKIAVMEADGKAGEGAAGQVNFVSNNGVATVYFDPQKATLEAGMMVYTRPQPAAQVAQPLTQERLEILWDQIDKSSGWCYHEFARAVEAEVLRLNGITGDGRGESPCHGCQYEREDVTFKLCVDCELSDYSLRSPVTGPAFQRVPLVSQCSRCGYETIATPPQQQQSCNYPDCTCPTESPCLKGLPQQQQAAPGAVPLESSQAASDAIDAMLAEYNYPSNPKNAARAGWRACRLYSAPKPQEPV